MVINIEKPGSLTFIAFSQFKRFFDIEFFIRIQVRIKIETFGGKGREP